MRANCTSALGAITDKNFFWRCIYNFTGRLLFTIWFVQTPKDFNHIIHIFTVAFDTKLRKETITGWGPPCTENTFLWNEMKSFVTSLHDSRSQVYVYTRISGSIDEISSKMIYNAFLRSNFDFCSMVWRLCGMHSNEKLEINLSQNHNCPYHDLLHQAKRLLLYPKTPDLHATRNLPVYWNTKLELHKTIFEFKEQDYAFNI